MERTEMRTLVIINTRSGGGDAGLYDFVRALGTTGTEVTLRFTDGAHPLEELVADAPAFDRIVTAGGDGTISAVCYAVRDMHVPVLAYPAGTANLIAQNLGMPLEPRMLAEVTMTGAPARFDIGEIMSAGTSDTAETRGFMVMAGAGYDASLIEAARPMKSTLGAAAYLLAAVSNFTPTVACFHLELDGRSIDTDGIAVLLVNFGRLQFDLEVARGADPRDGAFDVAVLRQRSTAELLPAVVAGIFDRAGGRDAVPGIDVYSASHVRIESDPVMRMQYDGEAVDVFTPFEARILPGAATLLLPPDSPFAR
jgi:diacylglycerol kinase family enzyme